MIKNALILPSLLIFSLAIGQPKADTINRYNDKGKKEGYWIRYLDAALDPTDSSRSFYYGFEYYDNGHCVFQLKKQKWHSKRKLYYVNPNPQGQQGKPILLNGHFKWYWYESGPIADEQIYVNGKPFFFKTYSWLDTAGTSAHNEVLYFDKMYREQKGSFYFEEYGLYGRLDNSGYMCKENNKWHYKMIFTSPGYH